MVVKVNSSCGSRHLILGNIRPSNIWVAGEHETRMDLSTLAHGRSWTTCINTYIEPLQQSAGFR